jgi:hypothetical protein
MQRVEDGKRGEQAQVVLYAARRIMQQLEDLDGPEKIEPDNAPADDDQEPEPTTAVEDQAGGNNWEKALAAVRPVHETYGNRLDEFKGQNLVGETSERYHAIRDEYLKAVRQVLAAFGFREGPPDKFDTPEKILVWLLWQDAGGTRTAAEIYLDTRAKAIDGGLNPPLPTGNAEHDLLTLRQWCQQQAGGKPGEAPPVGEQDAGKRDEAAEIEYDQDDDSLLDRLADILTPQGNRIIKHLWNRRHSTSYESLTDNCWDGPQEDETIKTALKRVQKTLNANPDLGVTIEIRHAEKRVKLTRPPDKSGDK